MPVLLLVMVPVAAPPARLAAVRLLPKRSKMPVPLTTSAEVAEYARELAICSVPAVTVVVPV